MYVLTLGSTDTDDKPIAVSHSLPIARFHAVKTLVTILEDVQIDGEYKTVRLPSLEDDRTEVYGNIHVGESPDDKYPTAVDWVYVTEVDELPLVKQSLLEKES